MSSSESPKNDEHHIGSAWIYPSSVISPLLSSDYDYLTWCVTIRRKCLSLSAFDSGQHFAVIYSSVIWIHKQISKLKNKWKKSSLLNSQVHNQFSSWKMQWTCHRTMHNFICKFSAGPTNQTFIKISLVFFATNDMKIHNNVHIKCYKVE